MANSSSFLLPEQKIPIIITNKLDTIKEALFENEKQAREAFSAYEKAYFEAEAKAKANSKSFSQEEKDLSQEKINALEDKYIKLSEEGKNIYLKYLDAKASEHKERMEVFKTRRLPTASVKNKYLKYKMKYLSLKKH
jgi:hypothetical protein